MEEEGAQILEINLISAQSLKTPIANLRRMQTYALLWVDPAIKLRSKIDTLGGENPTWNDKFLFRVSPEFISGETSGVSVEIYAVGYIKDFLVGTVRLLISNCLNGTANLGTSAPTPSLTAVQVRRPSGRFHGVLNIAASLSTDFSLLNGLSAVCFGDLMQEKENGRWLRRRLSRGGSKRSEPSSGGDSYDFSDGTDSTTSSSSSSAAMSTALKDWNCVRNMAGKKDLKSDGGGLLCGLMVQKKTQLRPLDQNLGFWEECFEKET